MANPYFQFKRFTVWHDRCAMKVGTDGALLGAWADVGGRRRILDVGTGTGLIALMLAQRNEAALVDAIDIDADACAQARSNAAKSPFAGRIHIHHTPLADYRPPEGTRYDLIVSNPPYFADSLPCPDDKRRVARHAGSLDLPDLLRDSLALLAPDGLIALILPFDRRETLLAHAREASLYPVAETHVSSVEGKAPKRLLVALSPRIAEAARAIPLAIETPEHHYTEGFTRLMRDFYLKI